MVLSQSQAVICHAPVCFCILENINTLALNVNRAVLNKHQSTTHNGQSVWELVLIEREKEQYGDVFRLKHHKLIVTSIHA